MMTLSDCVVLQDIQRSCFGVKALRLQPHRTVDYNPVNVLSGTYRPNDYRFLYSEII